MVGAQYRSDINKLVIHTMSIKDDLLDNPDAPVEDIDTYCQPRMQKRVNIWRGRMRYIIKKVDKWSKKRKRKEEKLKGINEG